MLLTLLIQDNRGPTADLNRVHVSKKYVSLLYWSIMGESQVTQTVVSACVCAVLITANIEDTDVATNKP